MDYGIIARDKKDMPLVSVIIPVYNVSRYLTQCLESVIHQTYEKIEIIVVDDGSTDKSGIICDEYALDDDRIIVLHTENKGLASARNTGLKHAQGEYLLFVDSDDWLELQSIKTLLNAAISYKAEIVTAGFCKEYTKTSINSNIGIKTILILQGDDIIAAYANGMIRTVIWNKLYNIKCFSNIRFPNGRNYEDVATTWRIMTDVAMKNMKIVVVPENLFHFRMRKNSITHTRSLDNIMDCWEANYEKYQGMLLYQDKMLPYCFYVIGIMWGNYYRLSKDNKDMANKIVDDMQCFSKQHFHHVMKGNYSVRTKLLCLLSQRKPLTAMGMGFWVRRIVETIRSFRWKKYD